MNKEQLLLSDFSSLPPGAQQEAMDFLSFLKLRYNQHTKQRVEEFSSIRSEEFIGMWRGRADMEDSNAWVRDLRSKEWS